MDKFAVMPMSGIVYQDVDVDAPVFQFMVNIKSCAL
jgi:hypothetical protein